LRDADYYMRLASYYGDGNAYAKWALVAALGSLSLLADISSFGFYTALKAPGVGEVGFAARRDMTWLDRTISLTDEELSTVRGGPGASAWDPFRESPHVAEVAIIRDGMVVDQQVFRSGNMTAEEAELGYPLSMLATHTESRATKTLVVLPGD